MSEPWAPIVCAVLLALSTACAPRHALEAPPGFARYGVGELNRWVTADGIVMRAREVDEAPPATLAFWTDALSRHLERVGYKVSPARLFRTSGGLAAARVDAIGHRGAEDWLLVTAIYVVGERLWLVEATGPYRQLQPLDAALQQALTTFAPADTAPR